MKAHQTSGRLLPVTQAFNQPLPIRGGRRRDAAAMTFGVRINVLSPASGSDRVNSRRLKKQAGLSTSSAVVVQPQNSRRAPRRQLDIHGDRLYAGIPIEYFT
jgi:hypothetical protein